MAILTVRGDGDQPVLLGASKAVNDRVLDERLQDEARDLGGLHVRGDVEDHPQPIAEAQLRAFREYLGSIRIAYGDRISIDDPNPTGAAARRAAVNGVLAEYGLFLEPVGPVSTGTPTLGTMRVLITRTTASAPPECADWRRQSNPEYEASTMSNFGCAVVSNIAAMTADPNDLVVGKAYEGADGFTSAKATGVYRKKEPTGAGDLRRDDASTRSGAKQ